MGNVIQAAEDKAAAATHPPLIVSVNAAGVPQVQGPLDDKDYCMTLLVAAMAIILKRGAGKPAIVPATTLPK